VILDSVTEAAGGANRQASPAPARHRPGARSARRGNALLCSQAEAL